MDLTVGQDRAKGPSGGSGTATLDPARYALSGRAPGAVVRPSTRDELCEALRAFVRDRLTIVPWGAGVALAHEPPPERYRVAVDLTGLDRVIEYEPEDLTLTAECGVTIGTLRKLLADRGQELPLEAAHADRATLGGVLAANASGPRRLRFGAPRDRILGARMALADGSMARSGGKVVKNVAGYGIHRLLCGSRGGLAIILEASLKLMPAPASRVVLIYGVTAEQLADSRRWSHFPRLEPALLSVVHGNTGGALSAHGDQNRFTVVVGFEDEASWVERQVAKATDLLGPPAGQINGEEAGGVVQALADLEEEAGPRLSFTTPHNTPAIMGAVASERVGRRAILHAPAGRLHLFPDPDDAQALVEKLGALEFRLIEARGVQGLAPLVPPMEGITLLRKRVRAALDPEGRMGLGNRWT